MRIIITGGGIGGLTAALCCLRAGHDVTVLEQAAALGEVGAGLQISPNSLKVLRALGLEDALVTAGFAPEALEMRLGKSGATVFSVPVDETRRGRWGAPYLHLHRADLVSVLASALAARAPAALRTGAGVVALQQEAGSVSVTLKDGTAIDGDVLIGADGIHSIVRAHVLGPDSPRFTGNVAWRAVVPMERLGAAAPPPTACVWVGPGRHAVTYRLRGGTLANFVGVVETPLKPDEDWLATGAKDRALADFAGWQRPVVRLIEEADSLLLWPLNDRPPLKAWVEGRMVLLGDAAHPMLPFMAQGASMAIEDAWVLAACLDQDDVPASLARYQQLRKPRATRVQQASRDNAGIFHRRSPLSQLATWGPAWLAGHLAPWALTAFQDWIYTHDVTAEVPMPG